MSAIAPGLGATGTRTESTMNILYRAKYYVTKAMLSVMGPAELPAEHDPMDRLERQRDAKLGPRDDQPTQQPPQQRHFHDGVKKAKAEAAAK